MKRGDIVTTVLPREQGKPRPAIIVQSDDLQGSSTLVVCPLSSRTEYHAPHRPELEPTADNGLRLISIAMTDKLQAAQRDRCGSVIGRLAPTEMAMVEAGIAYVLGMQRA